jgi:uncharacterized protein YdaU (DUF1376 family)
MKTSRRTRFDFMTKLGRVIRTVFRWIPPAKISRARLRICDRAEKVSGSAARAIIQVGNSAFEFKARVDFHRAGGVPRNCQSRHRAILGSRRDLWQVEALQMSADFRLTRVDFDFADFIASEDVAAMTAAEVGQYVLLLCAAWLGGKDATLPNDHRTLARLARATTGRVSPAVMRKFISTGGGRLANPRLTKEWKAACARAQVRRDKAPNAAEKRWHGDAPSMRHAMPGEYSAQSSEMPSSSSPNPHPNPEVQNHHSDDFRASLFEAKAIYLAKCEGDVSQYDFALTEIINRTAGPVSSPFKFFDKALTKFFDESNTRDRELVQQWLARSGDRAASATSPAH